VSPQRVRAVIWDFNGTLIDDVALAVRSINVLLSRRGLRPLSLDSYRRLFGFPMEEYYRRLGFDLSVETMTGLADEFHEAYLPGLPECRLHDGTRELLEHLRGGGASQFVLSAMEEGSLRAAIEHLEIASYFTDVCGLEDRLAGPKTARGRKLFERLGISGEDVLLIGDMDHDAEVGSTLGISVALVAQGHQAEERLRAAGCRVFRTFQELKGALS